MMHNAMCFVLCLGFRRSHSPHTNAFEKEAHGGLDTLLDGLSRRRAQCPTPRLASENQTEKHVCRELGVAHTDLVLLDIVREHARNLFHGRKPAFLMMDALKLGKSLGLHGDDSAYRESAGAPGHRKRVPADLRQSSFNVDPLQITIQTTKQS